MSNPNFFKPIPAKFRKPVLRSKEHELPAASWAIIIGHLRDLLQEGTVRSDSSTDDVLTALAGRGIQISEYPAREALRILNARTAVKP